MDGILGGVFGLAILGILVYYVVKGVNASRNSEALESQGKAEAAELDRVDAIRAALEQEKRRGEATVVDNVNDRATANRLLDDALKDDAN